MERSCLRGTWSVLVHCAGLSVTFRLLLQLIWDFVHYLRSIRHCRMSSSGKFCSVASVWWLVLWHTMYFFCPQLPETYDYVRISAFMTMKSKFLAFEAAEKSWEMSPPKGKTSEHKQKLVLAVSRFLRQLQGWKTVWFWGPTINFWILRTRNNINKFLKREKKMVLAFCFSPCSSSFFSKALAYCLHLLVFLRPEMPLEKDAINQSAGVWVLGIFQGYKMFSFHLPELTAAVTEHVPLENHKWAGCQVCNALWTEACHVGVLWVWKDVAVSEPSRQHSGLASGTWQPTTVFPAGRAGAEPGAACRSVLPVAGLHVEARLVWGVSACHQKSTFIFNGTA